ncbi:MAG: aminotransferase class V-fold PLP-dependent enzyme [Firmicutes bacterium]|nr:aminotransferase class V-fold PLP-dependent enzyme [Bacillota bacterium]
MIYFNNAATTQKKPEGVKHAEPKTAAELKPLIGELLCMKNKENIVLTQSGSQAMELVLKEYIKEGDRVISTVYATDAMCDLLDEIGAKTDYLGVDPYGTLKYDELEAMITPETKFIVCAHGCSVTGNIADLERICTLARRYDIKVIADGCQTVGAAEINLEAIGVDVYFFTGHKKLMGPYGIGGVCFKNEQAKVDFEEKYGDQIGEVDPKKIGGLYASVTFILEKGIYGISMWPHRLAKRFFESSSAIKKVRVYGNFGTNTRIPTVAISVEGYTAEEIKEYLRKEYGIVTKAGLHGCKKIHEALGTAEDGLVRVGIGYYNDRYQVNDAIWALMKLTDQMDFYLLS